jgi:hypothetical protein
MMALILSKCHRGGTIVRRWILLALLAGAGITFGALLFGGGAAPVLAQQATPTPTPPPIPQLPARFQGTVMMWGKKPSGSLTVTAYIGATACGSGSVKSGIYAVNVEAVQDAAGCGTAGAPVWFKLGDYWATEPGTWTQGQPQTLNLTGPKMEAEPLVAGCGNQMVITFSNKTPVKTIRTAVEPAAELLAIWKWNGKAGQWEGDFLGAPDSVNTLKSLDRLDSVWICVNNASTFTQPAIDFQ